jgi:hypothetical protein
MAYIRSSTSTERIHVLILDVVRAAITGAGLTIKVWRSSDGKLLDFADSTFKTSGHTSITAALTEHSAANNAGVYYADVPITSITNVIADDVYTFRIDQASGTTAVNLPAMGEVRVGRWVDTIGTNLDAVVSSRATDAGAASSVWGTLVPGSFGVGTAGANLDVVLSTRAAPGAAMTLANDSITAAAVATSAVTELQAGLATASAVAGVAGEVWGVVLPGAYGAGTAGANLGVAISTRAVAGDAMTLAADAITAASLATDAVTEIGSGVWGMALPGAFGAGTAGANLGVAVSSRAVAGDAMTLATDAVNAASIAADAVAEIQDGLALESSLSSLSSTLSSTPAAVWDRLLSSHTTPSTFGAFLSLQLDAAVSTRAVPGAAMTLTSSAITSATLAASAVTAIQSGLATASGVSAVPAAVWNVAQSGYGSDATTFGWAIRTLRMMATNRIQETPGAPGTLVVYADNGTIPFLTYNITDFNGNIVIGMVGAPARRAAATVTP